MKISLTVLLLFLSSFLTAASQAPTWADYGDTRRVAAYRQDKVPAQVINEPKYNLMQPNFWAQWEN